MGTWGRLASPFWAAVPALALLLAFAYEYQRAISATHERLEDALRSAYRYLGPDPSHDVRMTLHRPVKFPVRGFQQICNYSPQGTGRGRRHPATQGIIWKAHEAKARREESFKDDDEYRQQMVSEYSYTEEEMRERTADRRSYVCVPLVESDKVLGLLYLDSSDPNGLPPNGEVQRAVLLGQLEAIARDSLI